ncbi:hypothetical protein ACF05L_19730 [Streptomyces bobili]|uniref:hypothetical protein n=1 Tax=Streptomyces bobili TaxID=67280 RepID=UPI0036F764EE
MTLCSLRSAPLGELGLTGLQVSGAPFPVRVGRLGPAMVEDAAEGRLGPAMVEDAAEGLQLGM